MSQETSEILINNDIHLEEEEQVLFAAENRDESPSFLKTILLLVLIFLLFVSLLFIVENLSLSIFSIGLGIIIWRIFKKENNGVLEPGDQSYLILTSERIIASGEVFTWSQIHKIAPLEYLGNHCVTLQLVPGKLDIESRLSNQTFIIEPTIIFINPKKKTGLLYNKINGIWETERPARKLEELGSHLVNSYNLRELPMENNTRKFEGTLNGLSVHCLFKNRFPFEEFNVVINLPVPVPVYLKIKKEFTLLQSTNHINIDYFPVDNYYRIEGSHTTDIIQLFDDSTKEKMVHLKTAGVCQWFFGQPGKKEKTLPTQIQDNEAVLDVYMLDPPKEKRGNTADVLTLEKTLEFYIHIDQSFHYDMDSINDIIQTGMELSLHFAEGIATFSND